LSYKCLFGVFISCYKLIDGTGRGLPTTSTSTGQQQHYSRGGIGTCLSGVVHFTRHAESHKGYCHGGSMCSVMDDVIGWCGFVVTGQLLPWSGYTVQVNTRLQCPIPINSILPIQAIVTQIERRKIFITATIWNPSISINQPSTSDNNDNNNKDGSIHATCEGIFVVNKDVLG
jgi:hypothetical protein